jgi:hypothetical protein
VRLVHKQTVHAEFFKGERIVLLVIGSESLQASFEPLLGTFQFFHESSVVRIRVLKLDDFEFVQLFLEESFLSVMRQGDALET